VGEDGAAIDIRGGALIAATDPITLTNIWQYTRQN